jgi:hypothetical protein
MAQRRSERGGGTGQWRIWIGNRPRRYAPRGRYAPIARTVALTSIAAILLGVLAALLLRQL